MKKTELLKIHSAAAYISTRSPLYQAEVLHYWLGFLKSDVGEKGDITTHMLDLSKKSVHAIIKSKSTGIFAGREEVEFFFAMARKRTFPIDLGKLSFKWLKRDGEKVRRHEIIATLEGKAGDILMIERTLLNFLQRMSGIATLTDQYIRKVPSYVTIATTRKTLWGMLDKKAAAIAGASTHRLGLFDAILVKDTHRKIFRHDAEVLVRTLAVNLEKFFKKNTQRRGRRSGAPIAPTFLEIEVESSAQAHAFLQAYQHFFAKKNGRRIPLFLLFDNMKPALIRKTITSLKENFPHLEVGFEASGGINLHNIEKYGQSGVDVLSIGALTHSAKALDFSLKIVDDLT